MITVYSIWNHMQGNLANWTAEYGGYEHMLSYVGVRFVHSWLVLLQICWCPGRSYLSLKCAGDSCPLHLTDPAHWHRCLRGEIVGHRKGFGCMLISRIYLNTCYEKLKRSKRPYYQRRTEPKEPIQIIGLISWNNGSDVPLLLITHLNLWHIFFIPQFAFGLA